MKEENFLLGICMHAVILNFPALKKKIKCFKLNPHKCTIISKKFCLYIYILKKK